MNLQDLGDQKDEMGDEMGDEILIHTIIISFSLKYSPQKKESVPINNSHQVVLCIRYARPPPRINIRLRIRINLVFQKQKEVQSKRQCKKRFRA